MSAELVRPKLGPRKVQLVASGDLRAAANQTCWPAQHALEQSLGEALRALGYDLVRAHDYDAGLGHGFIDSQQRGREVFQNIDPDAPLIVAEAVWQYSHHVLIGLQSHRGPLLTVANWSGQWPGLVGLLNLNASLTKSGVGYSSLWSEDFGEAGFRYKLNEWLQTGQCRHATDHVRPLSAVAIPDDVAAIGTALADRLRSEKAILGVFDEGCMGMFNAIVPDHLLNPLGMFKERLSQSALYYETTQVTDDEARRVFDWYLQQGFVFHFGDDEAQHLTESQVLWQCKMYLASMRIADDFGCDAIGIQYQQGLKDLLPASDLVEGTINSSHRPPAPSRDGARLLYDRRYLPHFNEVDECAGVDALLIKHVHTALKQPVENTLHDIRWGDADRSGSTSEYVWVFEISGAAPAEHHTGGWAGSWGMRQPPMYFPKGGSTLTGVAKPGEIVWSRLYVADNRLNLDLGRGAAIELPQEETQRRWDSTTPQWPIMHAVTYGVTRDQMMAKHQSNHVQLAYATDADAADQALLARASMADALGISVNVCGSRKGGSAWR